MAIGYWEAIVWAYENNEMLCLSDHQTIASQCPQLPMPKATFFELGVYIYIYTKHMNSLLQKLGHRLSVFNRIYHMLDKRSLKSHLNGLVLPHLDYADVVWGDQPGLTTQTKQLQSFQNCFAKKIVKAKVDISWGPDIVAVGPTAREAYRPSMLSSLQDALKGKIPKHFDVFNSTMSQQHGYNTRNGYRHKVSRPRTEWGRNKTYYKAVNDWALLPSELKRQMPKTIFKHKLKQFLFNHFKPRLVFLS